MLTGKLLKIIRVNRELPQKELAEMLGVHQSYITQMETGKKPITKNMDKKIKEVLNLTEENVIAAFSLFMSTK
ncbi:helix-turn-helix domain-containing protein [Fictibacillus sp. 26RED30]|uniref:helix-turn-helix domain-containing protein n=1 Tax=Fictibacillus sp. 26RED30 TaxID=2745877 RepID=UPI0018CEFB25|nr:helix-turn-helix transcriptional regulator [Fictibacillus sp. 26RED30]MBH0159868.1 helix-turn-helix transcriptional regulator [Fictibacillus sp. 26RED30]